jgi:hypothetical protein
MTFLYNINRPSEAGAMAVATADIWNLYRHVCNPPAPGQAPVPTPGQCIGLERIVWDATATNQAAANLRGFAQGIDAKYGADTASWRTLRNAGNLYRVNRDTTPPP